MTALKLLVDVYVISITRCLLTLYFWTRFFNFCLHTRFNHAVPSCYDIRLVTGYFFDGAQHDVTKQHTLYAFKATVLYFVCFCMICFITYCDQYHFKLFAWTLMIFSTFQINSEDLESLYPFYILCKIMCKYERVAELYKSLFGYIFCRLTVKRLEKGASPNQGMASLALRQHNT